MIESGLLESLQINKESRIIGEASKRGVGSIVIHFNLFICSVLFCFLF